MTLLQNNLPAATLRSGQVVCASRLGRSNVFCLEAFGPLGDVKLDCLAFLQAAKAACLDSRERLESCRSCQFNSPHGTAGVERTFQFDESGGIASKNPHVRVWRLFPQEPCHQSSYTSDFSLHDVAYRFVFGVATCYRFLAFWKDLKFNHSRLWSSRH